MEERGRSRVCGGGNVLCSVDMRHIQYINLYSYVDAMFSTTPFLPTATTSFFHVCFVIYVPCGDTARLANMMKHCTCTAQYPLPLPGIHADSKCHAIRLLTLTFPSRVLRPLSSPFRCLEVELPLVLWLPSFPLPVPLDKEVEDWLTVLFRLGCSALGVRWRPDMEGEGTGSSFFSKDLLDLQRYDYNMSL